MLSQDYTALKICGVTRRDDVETCLAAGIDYVGFNFFPGSKRFLTPNSAKEIWKIKRCVDKPFKDRWCQAVGLFVDASIKSIMEVLQTFEDLSVIQLHGDESPAFVDQLKSAILSQGLQLSDANCSVDQQQSNQPQINRLDRIPTLSIWKAVGVGDSSDIEIAMMWRNQVDEVLFDYRSSLDLSRPEKDRQRGGTGRRFDWQLLRHWPARPAVAGGIAPDNVDELRSFQPRLVDVCSGVETTPGVKDQTKIVEVKECIRRWR